MSINLKKLRISPSDINSFFFCPRRWYLSIILGIPEMPVPQPERELGILVHNNIAEYYTKISEKPTPEEIQKVATDVFAKNYIPIPGADPKKYEQIMHNFISFEIKRLKTWKRYKPLLVEQRLEAPPFIGVVDAFFDVDKVVVDWKTGNYSVMNNDLMRQGAIYKILLEAHGYKVEKVIFVFLYRNKILEMPETTIGFVLKDIEQMVEMIKNGRFPGRNDKFCNKCPFQLACRFSDIHLMEGLFEEVML